MLLNNKKRNVSYMEPVINELVPRVPDLLSAIVLLNTITRESQVAQNHIYSLLGYSTKKMPQETITPTSLSQQLTAEKQLYSIWACLRPLRCQAKVMSLLVKGAYNPATVFSSSSAAIELIKWLQNKWWRDEKGGNNQYEQWRQPLLTAVCQVTGYEANKEEA